MTQDGAADCGVKLTEDAAVGEQFRGQGLRLYFEWSDTELLLEWLEVFERVLDPRRSTTNEGPLISRSTVKQVKERTAIGTIEELVVSPLRFRRGDWSPV